MDFDPLRFGARRVIDLMHHVYIEPLAGFLVVLVLGHELTI